MAALLVPFPYAIDDHQSANARQLSDAGGAVLIPESELDEPRLRELLKACMADPSRLRDMAARSRALGRPQATRDVGDACLEALHA